MDAIVAFAGRRYEVAFDRTIRSLAFVTGIVTDDATGQPVSPPFSVLVDEPLLRPLAKDAGYVLSGDIDVALTDATVAHPLSLSLRCAGYRHAFRTVVVPINPVFPMRVPIALRRLPVRLVGRVTELATGAAIGGARISLTGPALPPPQRAVLLTQPLAVGLSPAATLQGRAISPVASPVPIKSAEAAAPSGSVEFVVNDRQGLLAGQLMRLGAANSQHWAEIGLVSALPANPALPGTIRLTAPLARSLARGDQIAPFNLGATVGPTCGLMGDAFAGESVILLDDLPAGDVVEINDPPAPTRHVAQGVTASPAGDYAIDGLARVANPVLTASAPGFVAQNRSFPLPRLRDGATLDWRLAP
jgi:hypothetical protein